MQETPENQERVYRHGTLTYTTAGLVILSIFLLWGDFTWSMKNRAVGPSATLLIKQIGVSEFLYSLIIVSFPNFTNTFLGPIISYISDRHRGKWGRRVPFLLFTTPFIVFGLYFLGLCQSVGNAIAPMLGVEKHTAVLLIFCIGWVLLDFGTTLANSLFNALVNDVVPKQFLGRFFAMFRMVSLAAGMIFNYYLIQHVEKHALWIFLGIGTLYGAGLLSMCLKVKEGELPPPPPDRFPAGASTWKKIGFAIQEYFRLTYSLPYYRWIMAYGAISILMFMPVNNFSIQYAKALHLDMHTYGVFLVITYTISLCLSYFLGMLVDRFNPLSTGCVSLISYILLMLVSWLILKSPDQTADFLEQIFHRRFSIYVIFGVPFILHGVLSGCYFTLTAAMGPLLYPRTAYAQFASATGIVRSGMLVFVVPVIGRVLDITKGNYVLVFLFGAAFSTIGLIVLYKLLLNYRQHCVDGKYVAPLPPTPPAFK